jgi:fido (protein-threonine AMPylation protein)
VVAGRLAGAFARIKREDVANEIVKTMKAAGHNVRISDPFAPEQTFGTPRIGVSPIAGRLQGLWASLREPVIAAFPKAPGLPKDTKAYLQFVADSYQSDAYHSLSIEGYRVSPGLIERVRSGTWNPDADSADQKSRDTLAARGYWQVFEKVKDTVAQIIGGADAGALIRSAHRDWYRELFQPCVVAGIIKPTALAGYRNHFIYIKGSRYVPPRWEVVPDAMNAYFELLEAEKEPSVRAVLGHWLFGFIHPYPDGNGRIARFVMNAMLASGGYPWTVIRVEDREAYLKALESASIGADIVPFCRVHRDAREGSHGQGGKRGRQKNSLTGLVRSQSVRPPVEPRRAKRLSMRVASPHAPEAHSAAPQRVTSENAWADSVIPIRKADLQFESQRLSRRPG